MTSFPLVYIYILELEGGYYYVGRSATPNVRIEAHHAGTGAIWTQLHPMVRVMEVITGDRFDEDKYVLKTMDQYGIDKVRGGSYSNIKLTAAQRKSLESQLAHTNDQCARCGRKGHFIASCYAQTHHDGTWLAASPVSSSLQRKAYRRNSDGETRNAVVFLIYGLIFFLFFFFYWHVSWGQILMIIHPLRI